MEVRSQPLTCITWPVQASVVNYGFSPALSACGHGNGYTPCHLLNDFAILWLDASYDITMSYGYDDDLTGAGNTINTAGKALAAQLPALAA